MLLNYGVGEDSWESLGLQGDPTSPSWRGDQSWVFIGRTDAEAETPILWPPHVKGWLIGKDPGAGRDWGQEDKGTTEDEMAGWHHQLSGHGFEWTLGIGGLLACDWTELNWVQHAVQLLSHVWPFATSCTAHKASLLLCPMSEYPSGKREGLQDNAACKKGSLLLTRVRAPATSNAVVRGQRAPSLSCYTNL